MKTSAIIGISLLGIVWIWLATILISSQGVTLRSLLILAMSGIIIFVPLLRKYFKKQ